MTLNFLYTTLFYSYILSFDIYMYKFNKHNLFFSIWDHLVKISKDGSTTVIITTHYIDETRQAHMVSIPSYETS